MTTDQGDAVGGPGQDKNPTGGAKAGLAENSRSSEILLVPKEHTDTQLGPSRHPRAALGS